MTYYRRGEHTPIRTGRAARTRVGTYNSPQRRAANLAKVAERVNHGKVTTADYLTGELHAPAEFVASYASPYGRTVAKVYRAEFGREPERSGLDVRGKRLVRVYAYGEAELPVMDKAAREYRRTAELVAQRTEAPAETAEAEQQPTGTAPGVLVAELAERHAVPAGFVARRVEAILDGMRSNPRLYDEQHAALTPGGAAVVRSVLFAEHTDGMLYREAEAWQDAQRPEFVPGARVRLLVSDSADPVTGTVRTIERNAIGLDVAEVALPGGRTTHQVTRLLTAA